MLNRIDPYRVPTCLFAAAGLILGFAVAVATGSRPLGGLVMAALGIFCIWVWAKRDGRRTATWLTVWGLFMFAASHGLGLLIHPWPSVFVVSALTAYACWRYSDRRWLGSGQRAAAV